MPYHAKVEIVPTGKNRAVRVVDVSPDLTPPHQTIIHRGTLLPQFGGQNFERIRFTAQPPDLRDPWSSTISVSFFNKEDSDYVHQPPSDAKSPTNGVFVDRTTEIRIQANPHKTQGSPDNQVQITENEFLRTRFYF